jgi:hypothetical protein
MQRYFFSLHLNFLFPPKSRTKVSWILKNVPKTRTRGIDINRIKQLHTTTILRLWTLNLFYYCCKWLFDHPKSFWKAEGNLIIQKLFIETGNGILSSKNDEINPFGLIGNHLNLVD